MRQYHYQISTNEELAHAILLDALPVVLRHEKKATKAKGGIVLAGRFKVDRSDSAGKNIAAKW